MKKRDNNNMLYIIKNGGYKYYKIGISNNINNRISCLQVGNPVKIVLYRGYIIKYRHKLEKIERIIHNEFKDYKVRGEWFMLNKYNLQKVIDRIEELIEDI